MGKKASIASGGSALLFYLGAIGLFVYYQYVLSSIERAKTADSAQKLRSDTYFLRLSLALGIYAALVIAGFFGALFEVLQIT